MVSGGEMLFPNVYCALVAYPGVGKTRSIRAAKKYYLQTPDPHPAPTSMTSSSMIDAMAKAQRKVIRDEQEVDYSSMYITADELTAFMHKHEEQATGTMSDYYDPQPYRQTRRGDGTGGIDIKIKSPQLNMIYGATPSKLLEYMPQSAWEQGFMTRVVMVFSDERFIGDDFADTDTSLNPDLVHDLVSMSGLIGRFHVQPEYRNAVTEWRNAGEPPTPTHPKLIHYATRRRVHLYKLSMVAAIDRGDALVLARDDFDRGMRWLLEAEATMPDVFKAGAGNADARAMDEIYHYVLTEGLRGPVPERKIINFAREHIPTHSIERVIKTMTAAGMIQATAFDTRTGRHMFKACVPEIDQDGNLI